MLPNEEDTIVAEATPRGRGGIGVVRVSGQRTKAIAKSVLGKIPRVRHAEYLPFSSTEGEIIDYGIALFFEGPNSFTGEDVLELQGHGGPVVIDRIIRSSLLLGARPANPGEFTQRAFLNNKIDLIQAEAVADLIHASSEQAARGALRSLQGVFSEQVNRIISGLVHLRMFVEAMIDFPEEELDVLDHQKILRLLEELNDQISNLLKKANQGALLSEGAKVVILGKPNAGKSSLFNALSLRDSAIVTEIPGTTRDILREKISLDGLLLEVIDTAGIRESSDVVEEQGIRRALSMAKQADHLIVVVDGTTTNSHDPRTLFPEWESFSPAGTGVTVLYNKIDELKLGAKATEKEGYTVVYASVKTGEGLDLFKDQLKKSLGFSQGEEGDFVARRRHVESLLRAREALVVGREVFLKEKALELLAEELRQAQTALEVITGRFTSDDLLGKIFSQFCIGK